jgi:hypothetical protein
VESTAHRRDRRVAVATGASPAALGKLARGVESDALATWVALLDRHRSTPVQPDVANVRSQHAVDLSTAARRPDRLAFYMGYRADRWEGRVTPGLCVRSGKCALRRLTARECWCRRGAAANASSSYGRVTALFARAVARS